MTEKSFCVLYNPLASTGKGEEKARTLVDILGSDAKIQFLSLIELEDVRAFLDSLPPDTCPIITGGDGTLSRFVDNLGGNPTRDIYYYPAGTGNDFLNDLNKTGDTRPFLLNPYITDLPHIHFNGESHAFINGVGYGIDGYVCVPDELGISLVNAIVPVFCGIVIVPEALPPYTNCAFVFPAWFHLIILKS